MAYDDKNIKDIKNASSNWQDNYICDIRPMTSIKDIY